MANTPTEGILNLPSLFRDNLGLLAVDTATVMDATYGTGALKRTFLLKKLRLTMYATGGGVNESVLVGFAHGSLSLAEIVAILAASLADPTDVSSWDEFGQSKGIFWETLTQIQCNHNHSGALQNHEFSIGGGKGIPLSVNHGIQQFAVNLGLATLTGPPIIWGSSQLIGVYLNDD